MKQLTLSFDNEEQIKQSLEVFQVQGWTAPQNVSATEQLMAALQLEKWPFDDDVVNQLNLHYVLERFDDEQLLHVFSEINRVCCDGALIEVLAHHPQLTPSQNQLAAHALNNLKLSLLDQKFRQENADNLSKMYQPQALEKHPLTLNWQLVDNQLQLAPGIKDIFAKSNSIDQEALLQKIFGEPRLMQYGQATLIVHKVEGNTFARVSLSNLPRFVMCVYDADRGQYVSQLIKKTGSFEVEETLIVCTLIDKLLQYKQANNQPMQVKLTNAGANLGWYPLINTIRCPYVTADAFEPTPETVAKFECSIALNDLKERIKVYPIALSDAKGECQLFVDGENAGSNSLMEANGEMHHISKVITISADTMDNIYLSQPFENWPDIMVMDVEGHEQKVLDGAKQMLAYEQDGVKWQPIIVTEFSPSLLILRGECTFYHDFVEKQGYRAFLIQHGKANSIRATSLEELDKFYNDLKVNNTKDIHLDLVLLPEFMWRQFAAVV